jgi:type-F conjugative transfer system pilin assembly protein TrbC
MAQKKLLFILMAAIALFCQVAAGDIARFGIKENSSAHVDRQAQLLLPNLAIDTELNSSLIAPEHLYKGAFMGILESWQELQALAGSPEQELGANFLGADQAMQSHGMPNASDHVLRVFVSSSMGIKLLQDYARMANKFGARLILRGLPGESWQELAKIVRAIEIEDLALEIDDLAFEQYQISAIPAFVLAQEQQMSDLLANNHLAVKKFDKVTGNIGIKRALEMIETSGGDLAELATKILSVTK